MMTVTITCKECGSGNEVIPSINAKKVECHICEHETDVNFSKEHEVGILKECPVCTRMDFYQQKDFNRKIGVALFIIAAILSIFTYGISFIVFWLVDVFLFKKLKSVAICYKCNTIFRDVKNIEDIHDFNHEMNDRIVYSDHDFKGEQLDH